MADPRLTGILERARFAPGLTIAVALVAGFLLFQGVSLLVALLLIVVGGDFDSSLASNLDLMVETYAREFLIANTFGQFIGLLGFGWLLTRLHTRDTGWFLRLKMPDPRLMGLSIVGLLALIPMVHWVGSLANGLPWPESVRAFEQSQMELIERVLEQDFSLLFALSTMAITPAICEEVFFRGYLQRQAERSFAGWIAPVVLVGVLFGIYHLRPTQAIPLSMLGIYLAYATWRTGSLWPAVVLHFINNGLAVAVGVYVSSQPDMTSADMETMEIPGFVVFPAALLFVGVSVLMHRLGARVERPPRPGD